MMATMRYSVWIILLCVTVCGSVPVDSYNKSLSFSETDLCLSKMAPDLSCGTPTRERWFFNLLTGRCTTYRTCSPPTKIVVNDFSSKEKCERICIDQSSSCNRSCSITYGTCTRQANLAVYTCHRGFTLVGSKSRVCIKSGVWSSTAPECCRINIAMGSVTLESDRLSFDSGKSNINLDCTMDPGFVHGPPTWSFQREKPTATQGDLPWGVRALWTDSKNAYRLEIDRIGSEQAGYYTCKAGILQRTLEVLVNKAPIPSYKSFISESKCGSSESLFCSFQGDPAPNITWLRDGQQLSTGAKVTTNSYPIGVDGDYFVTSILSLSPITMASTGLYQCSAINKRGSVVVDIGQLQVACDVARVINSEDACRTSQCVLEAQVVQQIDEDLFAIRVKQVLKSPIATNSTVAVPVERVRLLGYSCWCQRLQVNGTYTFPGALNKEETVLEVDLGASTFWSTDDSALPQNCS